jgi:hypothetical protein
MCKEKTNESQGIGKKMCSKCKIVREKALSESSAKTNVTNSGKDRGGLALARIAGVDLPKTSGSRSG